MNNSDKILQKVHSMQVINKKLHERLKMMRNKTINLKISVSNNCTASLGVIADDYVQDIAEQDRMLKTLDKLANDITELSK